MPDLRGASLAGVNLRDALLFLGDPEVATPYDPDAAVNLATGLNTGAIVQDVDFTGVENINAGQRSYLCRSDAIGLDCVAAQP